MQPNETSSKAAGKNVISRYVIPLVALVVIVGGLAWVAQYLPSWKKEVAPVPRSSKNLVDFTHPMNGFMVRALWKKTAEPAKDAEKQPDFDEKDVETGSSGFYDFPFKNIVDQDLEVIGFTSTCDCASVKVCVLPSAEWERLVTLQKENPGEALPYSAEPKWHDLSKDLTNKEAFVSVKAGERGIVRVGWYAKKAAGQGLNLKPAVIFRRAGDPVDPMGVMLVVPVKMSQPIQFHPVRVLVPPLIPGTAPSKPAVAKFEVWSSTRPNLDFNIVPIPPDPNFVFSATKYDQKKCAALEKDVIAKKLGSRVLSACEVTLTVYETKDGRQLDLGPFYRKWPVTLDGRLDPEIFGPEIVGRVKGDITIGGEDDQGRIRFKTFNAKLGGSKTVNLSTDEKVELAMTDQHTPSWIEVTLTRGEKSGGQQSWSLHVNVPANTIGVRSFSEADAVTLKILGTPERYLRIPLEGQITGGN